MNSARLADFTGGWFIGNFDPAIVRTPEFEMGVKRYARGAVEAAHSQLTAWEVTVVVEGHISLGGVEFTAGEVVLIAPGEIAAFEALDDCVLVCVKSPSDPSDKVVA